MKTIVEYATQLEKPYIDAKVGATQSIIAPVEASTTASAAYAVNDKLILDGVLYKVTAAISVGDTITVGTNIVAADKITKQQTGQQLPIVDLGTSYTAELKQDISSGSFQKAVVGGRLTINGHVYYLAHPDYWLHTGDTECQTHHMVVVPASNLVSGKMNNDNSTTGGYVGSGMHSGTNHDSTENTALADIKAIIKADFGAANILTHREYLTNAVTDGRPSAGSWYDSDIDLMNENMVYGTNIFLPHPDGTNVPNLYTIDKSQLKLFAERPDLITIRALWWLRDVVSASHFAFVNGNGNASCSDASSSRGVRPAFAIC